MPAEIQLDTRERALVLQLKKIRLQQGISATALAEKIGLSRSTVTHTENDIMRPGLWVLLKIADGLKVKLSGLLGPIEDDSSS